MKTQTCRNIKLAGSIRHDQPVDELGLWFTACLCCHPVQACYRRTQLGTAPAREESGNACSPLGLWFGELQVMYVKLAFKPISLCKCATRYCNFFEGVKASFPQCLIPWVRCPILFVSEDKFLGILSTTSICDLIHGIGCTSTQMYST